MYILRHIKFLGFRIFFEPNVIIFLGILLALIFQNPHYMAKAVLAGWIFYFFFNSFQIQKKINQKNDQGPAPRGLQHNPKM